MENIPNVSDNKKTKEVTDLKRDELVRLYGSWCSKKATTADIISWCNTRIEHYQEWIKNLQVLKKENLIKLLDGFGPELQKIYEEKLQSEEADLNS